MEPVERYLKTGLFAMSKEEVVLMLEDIARRLNISLDEASLERTREILGRGESVSKIIREFRRR